MSATTTGATSPVCVFRTLDAKFSLFAQFVPTYTVARIGSFYNQRSGALMYGHVYHNIDRADSKLLEGFREIWTTTLSDAMNCQGIMTPDIKPIFENIKLVGSALTVLNYPNDNLSTHKSLLMAQPGDVLVIDEGPNNTAGSFGYNMSLQARKRGVLGVVTSGHMRDLKMIRDEGFPMFCKGASPRKSQKHMLGGVNVPVQVGGVVVRPGDIIVGDDDGVVVVPSNIAEDVLKLATERMKMEYQQASDIKEGGKPLEILYGDDWVDLELRNQMKEFR